MDGKMWCKAKMVKYLMKRHQGQDRLPNHESTGCLELEAGRDVGPNRYFTPFLKNPHTFVFGNIFRL
jgi:hypothetical protein